MLIVLSAVRMRRVACCRLFLLWVRGRGWRSASALAVERQKHQAEHVGRGQERRHHADSPQHDPAAGKRAEQDLVLAEETREKRKPSDREGSYQKCPVGDWQVLLQATHVAQVLLT